MIYVTGDTHGIVGLERFEEENFPQQKTMTKKDYVIVAGDFGLVWDNSIADDFLQEWL